MLLTETVADPFGGPAWQGSQYELGGVRFGGYRTDLIVTKADHGAAEVRSQDNPNPVGSGILFGRDYLGGPTWAFDLKTNEKNGPAALDTAERFADAWRSGIGLAPGKVVPLRYCVAGRVRRVYGRPRRYAGPDTSLLTKLGAGLITADFQCADHLHYDDELRSQQITLVAESTGGAVFPAAWPVETTPSGQRQGIIDDVGGKVPTPFEVVIRGPIRAPWAAGPGWRIDLPDVVLAYDQWLTASTYPWALTVLRNDGADLSGGLSPKSRLAGARMKPGRGEFTFGGVDPTNTATCTVQWRPAWHSL